MIRLSKAAKAARIEKILDALYPAPPIPLIHDDPFSLLVAVLLSAQTTDKKVNEVTPRLMALAPTPAALANLPEETIRAVIREVGLAPQKAKALKGLGAMLATEHGGQVPRDMVALERLPGVGHKTASVVMAQAFGEPAFPVDTHIQRLAARWGLSDGHSVERTEADLKAAFPRESWNLLHLQIIYFGREHCPARGHDLDACPICGWAATKARKAAEARAGTGKGLRNAAAARAGTRRTAAGATARTATRAAK